jgi:nitrile hydratase accessory protein
MTDFLLQPKNADGPVFKAPWEATAFGLVLALHKAGAFTWPEWASYLTAAIESAQAQGDADIGDTYYEHWLAALEAIAQEKKLTGINELILRKDQWKSAYLNTPHGQAVELSAGV